MGNNYILRMRNVKNLDEAKTIISEIEANNSAEEAKRIIRELKLDIMHAEGRVEFFEAVTDETEELLRLIAARIKKS